MDRQPAGAPSSSRARGRSDAILGVAAGIEMQVEVLLLAHGSSGQLLLLRALTLLLAVAVALHRRAPLVAVALAAVVFASVESLPNSVTDELIVPFFALLLIAYGLGANSEGWRLLAGVALLLGGGALAIRLDEEPGGADDFLFLATIIVGGPVLLGRLVRDRAKLGRALRAKTAALEADRAARSAAAVSQERARIAGELHGMVTTALASMVDRSGEAERLARTDPVAAAAALKTIETTGRDALGEIRMLLGVLRREDDAAALEPLPSLTHLADLVERARAAGLAVDLRVEGGAPELPAGIDLTAYRVVQEALGEALEAGGERRASVHLRYGERELLLDVTDAGASARDEGRGLLGVRERVALYGGQLLEEQLGSGGRAVRARLPLEGVR
jgi:signal transduction histidine kinase